MPRKSKAKAKAEFPAQEPVALDGPLTAVMEEVFQRPIAPAEIERLSELAEFARP